jgi:hypothetical protein
MRVALHRLFFCLLYLLCWIEGKGWYALTHAKDKYDLYEWFLLLMENRWEERKGVLFIIKCRHHI